MQSHVICLYLLEDTNHAAADCHNEPIEINEDAASTSVGYAGRYHRISYTTAVALG